MAAGYHYKLLNGESDMVLDEDEKSQRSQSRTICLLLIIFLLIFAVIGLFILVLLVKSDKSDSMQANGIDSENCLSPECIETSANVLKSMDLEVNPCHDMYHYACGRWIRERSLPPGYGKWSKFSELTVKNGEFLRKIIDDKSTTFNGHNSTAITKLKSYYRTCMDEETIENVGTKPLMEIMRNYGLWSVTSVENSTWNEAQWNFQDSLIAMHKKGSLALFTFAIVTDSKDTNKKVIKIAQAGLTLASSAEYFGERSQEFKEAFLSFVTEFGLLLGGVKQDVREKMEQVYNLEKNLADIFVPSENLTNPFSTYNKMTLKEFQENLGAWVDIQSYLSDFFGDRSFKPSDIVVVATPSYFRKLGKIVETTNKEVLANYMMWMLLKSMLGFLPDAFTKAILPLAKVESGITALPERWQKCMSLAKDGLGFAASALFVKSNFRASSKEQVVTALHKVTQEFIKNLDSVTWLDDITKKHLKEKAEVISYKVGYPEWIMDPKTLDEYYEKLIVNEGEFLRNWLHLLDFSRDRVLNKYGMPTDKSEWPAFPHSVNAFYNVQSNEVVIPAGILQPPFFSPHFPKPFLYSSIGMVVGHEMTHGFDDNGRLYDKNGNLGDQWTAATSHEYEKKANCMIEQYGNYSLVGHRMNGKLTLNENIADNGGLLMAYKAFKNDHNPEISHLPGLNLSDDQMFFLGFSQLWCSISSENYKINSVNTAHHLLGELRVRGIVSNFPQFSKAFNCPVSSDKKCKVW